MTESHIERFLDRLRNLGALRNADTIRTGELDSVQPAYADDWPRQLNPDVRSALACVVDHPYQHQADAIALALSGADVVMEAPTASGKTLAFAAPMLHALKENPGGYAMMIYPMKALAFDQREQIRALCEPLRIDSWPYDGDTDDSEKEQIRKQPPHILLTNPEYLNMSFLGQRKAWNKHAGGALFLRNLRYVVIDEMHEYRGFFGSNMALLLRRFFLHLDRINAHPQVFLSTATCANPQEHANALTGRNVELVSARGTLRPRRSFVFVQPEIPDFRYWDILRHRIEQAAVAALAEGLHVLIFCPTKKFLEEAFGNARHRAGDEGLNPFEISAYHADLKSNDRQDIQGQIKSGEIRVVFTTNALEIGLDVGGLDGVILAGFPPSIMSAWQQIGRAGRGWDRDAFVLFYAMNDPIDRFFVSNLDAFLDKPFDELVVDPGNDELIKRHLPSLLEETGGDIAPSDEATLGGPFYRAASEAQGAPPRGDIPPASAQPQRRHRPVVRPEARQRRTGAGRCAATIPRSLPRGSLPVLREEVPCKGARREGGLARGLRPVPPNGPILLERAHSLRLFRWRRLRRYRDIPRRAKHRGELQRLQARERTVRGDTGQRERFGRPVSQQLVRVLDEVAADRTSGPGRGGG